MGELWLDAPHVRCCHPGQPILRGRLEVMQSWADILLGPIVLQIEPIECVVVVCTSGLSAWTSQDEIINGMRHRIVPATNCFQFTNDRWYMVSHHGSALQGLE